MIDNGAALKPDARLALAQTLAADPAIASVAQSTKTPFNNGSNVVPVHLPGNPQKFTIQIIGVGSNFMPTYGVHLLAGRNLSRARATDVLDLSPKGKMKSGNILISAMAARQFGFTPASAIGHTLVFAPSNFRGTIVGVVDNAKFGGLQPPVQPVVYGNTQQFLNNLTVRIKPDQTRAALAAIDHIWHRFAPNAAIDRHFLDSSFDRLFAADEQEGTMFGIFVAIAIFIACLGLFGLAAFTAERRTREIGIRKAFGARTRDIVRLLLWQFSIPVLIANLIAWPVAWYYLHGWLETYAYRISLNPLYFLAAGLVALLIAWATVIAHAVIVARANPVHALRYE